MVVVAQLVRALDCGSRGRRFETGLPPPIKKPAKSGFFYFPKINFNPYPLSLSRSKYISAVMYRYFSPVSSVQLAVA